MTIVGWRVEFDMSIGSEETFIVFLHIKFCGILLWRDVDYNTDPVAIPK